jgi:hypothetical protein
MQVTGTESDGWVNWMGLATILGALPGSLTLSLNGLLRRTMPLPGFRC